MRKLIRRLIFLLVAVGIGMYISSYVLNEKFEEEIITVSKLEKIINLSELNTFEAVYNGISVVMNENETDKLDYYVSYEAKVSAGFNFDELVIVKDEEAKKIIISIPTIEITDVNVDIASLDYMFRDNKANKSSVSEQAYKSCIDDVTEESKKESAIYELAKENAKNIIEALVRPFIEEFNSDYLLEIN